MTYRERVSATVRAGLLDIGRRAVAEGRAPTLSAWVDEALARQAEHDRRMKALDDFFTWYEAKHGAITREEIDEARRWAKTHATTIRPAADRRRRAKGRRGAA